jgi:hypothetical protein
MLKRAREILEKWKWVLILLGIAIPMFSEYWLLPHLHLGKKPDAAWLAYWREVGPQGTVTGSSGRPKELRSAQTP